MPVSWTTVFRGIVLLLMAVHVFYLYSLARSEGWIDAAGGSGVVGRSFFALVMLLPLSWAVLLPDLPEIYRRRQHLRRYTGGKCPECSYPVRIGQQNRPAQRKKHDQRETLASIIAECNELISILVASIKTAEKNK